MAISHWHMAITNSVQMEYMARKTEEEKKSNQTNVPKRIECVCCCYY